MFPFKSKKPIFLPSIITEGAKGGASSELRQMYRKICTPLWHRKHTVSARKKGVPFALSKEDFKTLYIRSGGCCEITGQPFDPYLKINNRYPFRPSIDRIDPSKGYTLENCRLVSLWVNLALNVWGLAPLTPFIRVRKSQSAIDIVIEVGILLVSVAILLAIVIGSLR